METHLKEMEARLKKLASRIEQVEARARERNAEIEVHLEAKKLQDKAKQPISNEEIEVERQHEEWSVSKWLKNS
jgi:hypothetical protein